jgi:pyridoxine/pyridoxamine 5'-phosphate oxidase
LTAEEVVEACCAAWSDRDLEGTLAWLDKSCIYDIHVPTDVLHFAGRHEGKPAIRKCLAAVLEEYGFLAYALDWLTSSGSDVHSQIVYYYTHMESGQQIDGASVSFGVSRTTRSCRSTNTTTSRC